MNRFTRSITLCVPVLLSLVCLDQMPGASVEPKQSEWIYPGADEKLVYKQTAAGDRIMDFSFAGYMGGGVPLPTVAVKKSIRSSGQADDTKAIQAAIDEVAKLPLANGFRGAVLLEPGKYTCSDTIVISASGVVLRGSGSGKSTIELVGKPHLAISVRLAGVRRRGGGGDVDDATPDAGATPIGAGTSVSDQYIPSGATRFSVKDATGFSVGDWIAIRRPVTDAWIRFMHMDDLVRDGKPQTWIKAGNVTTAERKVVAVSGSAITIDVPLSDSFDAKYLNPPGTRVTKIPPPAEISQVGIEDLHIECPPQAINHTQPHFQAIRISGQDCWARDVVCDETMNSVGVSGRRITLERVSVNRKTAHVGASKPAEFAPNGTQVLLDKCSVTADNVWFTATGAGVSGPVVLLNCTFHGDGRSESHQRWSTGILYDNCHAPEGGIEMRNRGSMGSGHGWSMGWGVMWNCESRDFLVQNPPGALNWMIGCVGESSTAPRPFGTGPTLAEGVMDSQGNHVAPESLYLAQLRERLGAQSLKNIGY